MSSVALERTLTELDHVRLMNLVHRDRLVAPAAVLPLEEMLDNAFVVPSRKISPDVVTMYSQIQVRDLTSNDRKKLTICYPADAEPADGFVSVLSPVGWNMLGMPVGSVVRWPAPGGAQGAAEIVAVPFQPEASGDYTT